MMDPDGCDSSSHRCFIFLDGFFICFFYIFFFVLTLATELFGGARCDNLVRMAFKELLDGVHGCELSHA